MDELISIQGKSIILNKYDKSNKYHYQNIYL